MYNKQPWTQQFNIIDMKHEDIVINQENPFANCKLGREPYANILSSIVDSYAKGFVLAINGEWGVGKTTFVKMWRQKLENEGHKTIYFNAWENDFVSEPMVGILGELKSLITSGLEKHFDSILEKAAKFSNKMIPTLAKEIAKKCVGEEFVDLIEKGAEATTALLKDEIKNYDKQKEGLKTLKDDLCDFVSQNSGGKPVVFIIDELDRCRPDYAVEVLEKVKHFFSVQGIIFVLSIDKKQLGNSIRGYYGSDRINADEYLRRFIDIEYNLPEPSIEDFCKYLYNYFIFDDFFGADIRRSHPNWRYDKELFLKLSTKLLSTKHLTLRQIEKLYAHTRLTLRTFLENQVVTPDVLFLLIYIKYYESDLYNSIKRHELSIQDFVNQISNVYANCLDEDKYERRNFITSIAGLIYLYNAANRRTIYHKPLFETPKDKDEKLNFDPNNLDEDFLFQALKECQIELGKYELSTKSMIEKIDLIESLK